jgi:hypothetical protein
LTADNKTGREPSGGSGTASISVFFPCYNEQANIERIVGQAVEVLEGVKCDFEVIVVNDGSTDETGPIADRLAASDPRIKPVHHCVNLGYGAALQSGFRAASKDLVFYTDGDGQFDIAQLPPLVPLMDECDIVSCYRLRRRDSAVRKANAWLWTKLVSLVFDLKIRDIDCAFKLFKREVFEGMDLTCGGAMIDTEILARAQRRGFRIIQRPVDHYPRLAGRQTGAKMKVILVIGKVFNPVWWLMGFEQFSLAIYDQPGLVGRLFERVGTIQYRVLERALEHRCVGAHWHADDVAFNTSLMVSPAALRQYAFPWFRRMVDLCHDREALAIFHSDGRLDQILEEIIEMGFDGLNPIQPGANDIGQVRQQVGGRISLLGNIDLDYTLTQGTPAEVDEEVRVRIRDLAPGGGYCLSSANSIPDYVPFENYMAMRDAWLKYGRYPIQLD